MKQKVALIRGFLTEPDFVMLDEPFKSLDLLSKQAIIRHILAAYPDITLLFVTHTIEEVPLLTQSLLLFKPAGPIGPIWPNSPHTARTTLRGRPLSWRQSMTKVNPTANGKGAAP